MIKRLSVLLLLLIGGVFLAPKANAAILETAFLTLDNPRSAAEDTNHEYTFNVGASTNMGSVKMQYCVNPSGTCTDTGVDVDGDPSDNLTYVEEATNGNDSANWTESWQSDAWIWWAYRSSPEGTTPGTTWVFNFDGMTNPTRTNCSNNSPANYSTGTCYVKLNTYPTSVWTGSGDNSIVSLTVTQAVTITARVNPTFQVRIDGIDGGVTRNNTPLTSGISTTVTTIPFGNLTAGTAYFAGHLITVTGNNSGGYTVTAQLDNNLTGAAYDDPITPFYGSGDDATTTQAQDWAAPDGTASGTNTGWIGVGTDDTGVANRGNNQFFRLDTNGTVVAETDGPSDARQSNVVYGIQVNAYQQADNYEGVLTYNALPTY